MGGTFEKLLYILKNVFILGVCAAMIWIAFIGPGRNDTEDDLYAPPPPAENPQKQTAASQSTLPKNLTKYEPFNKFQSGLMMANGIAIDSTGMLLVVGENQMIVIDPKIGSIVQEVLIHQGAVAVCADRWGTAVVSRNKLLYSPGTLYEFETICTFSDDSYLTAVASNGNSLFVADAGLKAIYKVSREGEILKHITPTKDGIREGFAVMPKRQLDVIVGKRGMLWATNPGKGQILSFTPEGIFDPALTWGSLGDSPNNFQGTFNPIHITMLPNMNFVVSELDPNSVKVFDETGQLNAIVAGPNDLPVAMHSLAVTTDNSGNIYVLNDKSGDITAYRIKPDSAQNPDVFIPLVSPEDSQLPATESLPPTNYENTPLQ